MEGVVCGSVGAGSVSVVDMNYHNVHRYYFQLGPMLSSGACVFRVWRCSTEPCKKADEFFRNASIKIHIPNGGVQRKKKKKKG